MNKPVYVFSGFLDSGKTQTINFYLVNNEFYLVDVPGYGYAQVDRETQKKFGLMIEEYLKTRDNLKCVFLLVDYRHKPTEDDILMFDFLKKQGFLVGNYFKVISGVDQIINLYKATAI